MGTETSETGDSPMTPEQRRSLRRIRRVQVGYRLSLLAILVGLAFGVFAIMTEGIIASRNQALPSAIYEYGGWVVMWAALAVGGLLNHLLKRAKCPRCGREYFKATAGAQPESGRRESKSADRAGQVDLRARNCANCGLSIE
jgi:ribosomal protein S27AE